MLNNYTILHLFALVAFIQCMPTDNTDSSEKKTDHQDKTKSVFPRELQKQIDGSTHHLKSAGITYQQRIINGQCLVEYAGQLYGENSIIKSRKKVFRMEECVLERVYHACGPNLLLMLSLVCQVVDQHKTSNTLTHFKRETSLSSTYELDSATDRIKRVISESCCENLCNIAEITRYCHT